jgi:hypothetical protein
MMKAGQVLNWYNVANTTNCLYGMLNSFGFLAVDRLNGADFWNIFRSSAIGDQKVLGDLYLRVGFVRNRKPRQILGRVYRLTSCDIQGGQRVVIFCKAHKYLYNEVENQYPLDFTLQLDIYPDSIETTLKTIGGSFNQNPVQQTIIEETQAKACSEDSFIKFEFCDEIL